MILGCDRATSSEFRVMIRVTFLDLIIDMRCRYTATEKVTALVNSATVPIIAYSYQNFRDSFSQQAIVRSMLLKTSKVPNQILKNIQVFSII